MPKIVRGPQPRLVLCAECRALIEYLPEEVETDHRVTGSGSRYLVRYVKCPRRRCPGEGIVYTSYESP